MGTRTNLYKNPSYTYNKDLDLNSALQNLRAYNAITGIDPPSDEPATSVRQTKRRRDNRIFIHPPSDRSAEAGESDDGPMSHRDYIQKRRKEIDSSHVYQELTADVLGRPCLSMSLVQYDSEGSSSSECEEKLESHPTVGLIRNCQEEMAFPSHCDEADRVKNRNEQRFALLGEPLCVVCGRYGEYICDETEDDICSIDCKAELLKNLKLSKEQLRNQKQDECFSQDTKPLVVESGGDTWDHNRMRWSKKRSSLCTYECWKCQKPGHLANDCLLMTPHHQPIGLNTQHNQVAASRTKSISLPRDLVELYKRCHQLGKHSSAAKCNSCCRSSTLATCLGCSNTFCDRSNMLGRVAEQIRLFCSQVKLRRFNDRTLQVLESALVFNDVKSLLDVQLCLRKFLGHESLCIIYEIADMPVDYKLHILQFLVQAFALAGDIENCLALRYEALILRQLKSADNQWLEVSCKEWMSFAEHAFDNGFYSISKKACENAVSCFQKNGTFGDQTHELLENSEIIDHVNRLKDVAMMSSGSRSIQAHATKYMQKRALETSKIQLLSCKETQSLGSVLFRDGIKKRNKRNLRDLQGITNVTAL